MPTPALALDLLGQMKTSNPSPFFHAMKNKAGAEAQLKQN
jgi:hypothetical protein